MLPKHVKSTGSAISPPITFLQERFVEAFHVKVQAGIFPRNLAILMTMSFSKALPFLRLINKLLSSTQLVLVRLLQTVVLSLLLSFPS